ncbi:MAG: transporter [Nocardioidaceae bacterium]|nr:transporter [Nocardioidaceae bacterium]
MTTRDTTSDDSRGPGGSGDPETPRQRGLVAVLCLVQFVDVLGVTVVITALPSMLRDLDASPSQGTLIVTGYAMFFGGLLMTGARVGDRFGHRRTIVVSCGVFAAASLVGAVAQGVPLLAASRCLQGAAAATAVPAALRLLTTLTAEGQARRRALAAWSAAGAAAGASGFVVGGVLTQAVSWRAIFWLFIVLAAALVPAMLRTVPADGRRGRRLPLNPLASVLLTGAVMALVLGTTWVAEPAQRAAGVALVLVAALGAAAYLAVERRSAHPLVPRGAFGMVTLRAGTVGSFLNTATTSSAATLVMLELQDSMGRSPLEAAALLLPMSLLVIVGSVLAAPLLRWWTPRVTLGIGLGAVAVGTGVLPVAATVVTIPLASAVSGLGLGIASVAANGMATDVPVDLRGAASGLVNTAAQLGTAVGTAALILLAAATDPRTAWAAATAVALAAAAAFVRTGRRDPERHRS